MFHDENAVIVQCRMCNEKFTIPAKDDDIKKWQNGAFIQDAMPYLNPAQRELLISRTCNDCFNSLWPEEDEE